MGLATIGKVLLLSLALCSTAVAKKQEPQNYLVVCGANQQITLAYQGELVFWEMHVKSNNPYLELQTGDQSLFHYLQAGETCSVRAIEEGAEQGGSSRIRDNNA